MNRNSALRIQSALVLIVTIAAGFVFVAEPPTTDGEALYRSRCLSCHQVDGKGITGVFPPLVNTEWVTGDRGRLIRIVLDGMMGEVQVNGATYSGAMPPWKAYLNDEEVAALLTYVRTSWGNLASPITASQVIQVRKATANRTMPWTAEELMQSENQGVPGSLNSIFGTPDTTHQR